MFRLIGEQTSKVRLAGLFVPVWMGAAIILTFQDSVITLLHHYRHILPVVRLRSVYNLCAFQQLAL